MRKQELDNWIKNGGDLPQNLTEDEKSYLKGLGWEVNEASYANGQKHWDYNCLHGKLHGKYKCWHSNGQKGRVTHHLNGKRHGKYEWWHKNGQKRYEKCYHHGKKHGVWKSWDDDGTLYRHEEYAYGVFLKGFLKRTS